MVGVVVMTIRTYGPNAVDWEERVDLDRLRRQRLARLHDGDGEEQVGIDHRLRRAQLIGRPGENHEQVRLAMLERVIEPRQNRQIEVAQPALDLAGHEFTFADSRDVRRLPFVAPDLTANVAVQRSYRNMKEYLAPYPRALLAAEEAVRHAIEQRDHRAAESLQDSCRDQHPKIDTERAQR